MLKTTSSDLVRHANQRHVFKPALQARHNAPILCLFGSKNIQSGNGPYSQGDSHAKAMFKGSTGQMFFVASFTMAHAFNGGSGPGGMDGGGSGGGGSGGDGSFSSFNGSSSPNVVADISVNETSELVEEVILLDVGGMRCGGCVGHVKKILESQPNVTQASVNLTTETALVRVMVPKGQRAADGSHLKVIGDQLAQAVTAGGFKSSIKSVGADAAAFAQQHY